MNWTETQNSYWQSFCGALFITSSFPGFIRSFSWFQVLILLTERMKRNQLFSPKIVHLRFNFYHPQACVGVKSYLSNDFCVSIIIITEKSEVKVFIWMWFCCLFFDFQRAALTIRASDSSSIKWNNNIYIGRKEHLAHFLLIDASITHPSCLTIEHNLKFLLDYLALKTMFWNNYRWLTSFVLKSLNSSSFFLPSFRGSQTQAESSFGKSKYVNPWLLQVLCSWMDP